MIACMVRVFGDATSSSPGIDDANSSSVAPQRRPARWSAANPAAVIHPFMRVTSLGP